MRRHTVKVWGHDVEVDVYQKSKSVWVAAGSYLGEPVSVSGRTAMAALGLWRKTAEFRGN